MVGMTHQYKDTIQLKLISVQGMYGGCDLLSKGDSSDSMFARGTFSDKEWYKVYSIFIIIDPLKLLAFRNSMIHCLIL